MRNHIVALAKTAAMLSLAVGMEAARAQTPPASAPPEGQPAPVQEESGSALPDIIVTAERRAQNLQDVPLAVTVFSGEQRDQLGLVTIEDVVNATPGMSISANKLNIRGVGQQTVFNGNDPGVAVYVDGFFNGTPFSIGTPQFLVERTEILRGPQGTLYGRNSIGGAVNTVTKRPGDRFEGGVSQTIGNYDTSETIFRVGGPLTERLRAQLSGFYLHRGGSYNNNVAGIYGDGGVVSEYRIEGQIDYRLSDAVSLWLRVSHDEIDDNSESSIILGPYDTVSSTYITVPNPTFGFTEPNPSNARLRDVDRDTVFFTKADATTVIAHLDVDLGGAALKYVGGYADSGGRSRGDLDGTSRKSYLSPVAGTPVSTVLIYDLPSSNESWSNEITLSSAGDRRLDWIVGAYQYHERKTQAFDARSPLQDELETPFDAVTFAPVDNPDRTFFKYDTKLKAESYAIFGQADYDLTQAFRLTLGARYTWDRKRGDESLVLNLFDPDTVGPFSLQIVNAERQLKESWEGVTGRANLQWTPSEDVLAYASYSRGYKSGGFSLGTLGANPQVDEETIDAFAAGVKWTLGRRLRLNAEAFYYDYKDLQVSAFVQTIPGFFSQIFVNAPEAHSEGFELEAEWSPISSFNLLANYSYLHARFGDFPNIADPADPAQTPLNLKGRALPQSPEHKFYVAATYTVELGVGDLALLASHAFTDDQSYGLVDNPSSIGDSFGLTDLRVVYTPRSKRYNVTAFVKNLTDETYLTNVLASYKPGPGITQQEVTPGAPRTYGVKLEYFF